MYFSDWLTGKLVPANRFHWINYSRQTRIQSEQIEQRVYWLSGATGQRQSIVWLVRSTYGAWKLPVCVTSIAQTSHQERINTLCNQTRNAAPIWPAQVHVLPAVLVPTLFTVTPQPAAFLLPPNTVSVKGCHSPSEPNFSIDWLIKQREHWEITGANDTLVYYDL